jgi:hypothetical protein
MTEITNPQSGQKTLTLSTLEKVIGIIVIVGGMIFSFGGNYLLTNYRLTDLEKRADQQTTLLSVLNQQQLDLRITHLESAKEENQKVISQMSSKLDVVIAILDREERMQEVHNKAQDQK